MSTVLLAAAAVVLCVLFRILNVNSQPQKPSIWCCDDKFLTNVLKVAPLNEVYIPTRLWGFSGHMQTILNSIISRINYPKLIGERISLYLKDGSTLTYDMYLPPNEAFPNIIIAICPGICNTSETGYIRTFVQWAQQNGYKCAVLNHLGALPNVPITSPRTFVYGDTFDYATMLNRLSKKYPDSKIVCVGFSMGGNIVAKYLGEKNVKSRNLVGAISVCQSYSSFECATWLVNYRRFYQHVINENLKKIILQHRKLLLSDGMKRRHNLNEQEVMSASTLLELDEVYTRRLRGFNNIAELYQWSSSINYFDNISLPIVFINAKDDPIIPETLLESVKKFAAEKKNMAYIEVAHGGHLGFYEGGLICPNSVTWLERTLTALVETLVVNSKHLAVGINEAQI